MRSAVVTLLATVSLVFRLQVRCSQPHRHSAFLLFKTIAHLKNLILLSYRAKAVPSSSEDPIIFLSKKLLKCPAQLVDQGDIFKQEFVERYRGSRCCEMRQVKCFDLLGNLDLLMQVTLQAMKAVWYVAHFGAEMAEMRREADGHIHELDHSRCGSHCFGHSLMEWGDEA
jgi:hypothetical protein